MSKTSLFNSRLKTDWIFFFFSDYSCCCWYFCVITDTVTHVRVWTPTACLDGCHHLCVCVWERLSFINEKTTPSSESWRARGEHKLMYWKGNRLTHTQCIENNVEVAASLYFVLQVYRRREGHTWETELHRSLLKHGRNRC